VIPQRRKDGAIIVPADASSADGLPLLGGPVRVVLPGDEDWSFWDAFAVTPPEPRASA